MEPQGVETRGCSVLNGLTSIKSEVSVCAQEHVRQYQCQLTAQRFAITFQVHYNGHPVKHVSVLFITGLPCRPTDRAGSAR